MNHLWYFLPIGYAPGVFWLWWFYRRDKYEPEPRRLILRTVLLGGVAGIAAGIVEWPWQDAILLSTIFIAPVVEELAKFLVVWWWRYRDPEFDEPMDGVVYAAAAALGFASLENVSYVAIAYERGGTMVAHTTFWARALLSVPGHALFSSLWGAALGKARFAPPEQRRRLIARGLILAICGHSAWNLLGTMAWSGGWVLCLFAFVLWGVFNRNVRELLARSPYRDRANRD